MAAERYRLAEGHWPEAVDAVVPRYLSEVPRGPYDDKPIRLVRKDDGVVAYAVGPGREDLGGQIQPEWKLKPKSDSGEQLWNPQLRHRPAADPATAKPAPEESPGS